MSGSEADGEAERALGPKTAAAAALRWLTLVVEEDDWAAGWPLLDPETRAMAAGCWLWAVREHIDASPATIGAQTVDWAALRGLEGRLWNQFCLAQMTSVDEVCEELPPISQWGTATRPRPVGVDQELVLFVLGVTETVKLQEGDVRSAEPFLMRLTPDGWKVRVPFGQTLNADWPPDELAPYLP